jgi:hypothetical protein
MLANRDSGEVGAGGTGDRHEVLLGYDAREMSLGFRPNEFLLRRDLDGILSADTMVWPSVVSGSRNQWIGMNAPFWDDLNALKNAISKDFGESHPFWLIAATWHTDRSFEEEADTPGKFLGPHIAPKNPRPRDPAWRLLGFDIADPGISGLSNCGYEDGERAALAAKWGPHLNRYHLFDSLEPALEFRTLTNARVPEHAPFFVIGLWWIVEAGEREAFNVPRRALDMPTY